MADKPEMPKVDFTNSVTDEKLRTAYIYSKYVESKNATRAVSATRNLRNGRIIGGICGLLVVSIYSYTILRIKQETFLDDFEEPPRVIKQ